MSIETLTRPNPATLINQTSGDTEYYTPKVIVDLARYVMGGIDLDPASSEYANRVVKATKYFTAENDGLKQRWHGRVWLNHPFGRGSNRKWMDKLFREFEHENVTEFCCITYACTSEAWFRPLLAMPQCFLIPRTNYYLPDGTLKRGVTKGSVVTYGGPNVEEFSTAFASLGIIKVRHQF